MHIRRQDRVRSFLAAVTPSLESGDVTINVNLSEDPLNEEEKGIDEAAEEATLDTEAVEELDETQVALEGFADEVQYNYDNGGMSPSTARMLARGLEFHYSRLNIDKAAPSLESFASVHSRREQTRVSLEDIKETAKNVWQALKNAILKAIKSMMDFFAKIAGGFKQLKERATKVKEAASNLNSDKEGDIKLASASYISMDGKVDAGTIVTSAEKIGKLADYVLGEMGDTAVKLVDGAAALLQKNSAPEVNETDVTEGLGALVELATPMVTYMGNKENTVLSGGYAVQMEAVKMTEAAERTLAVFTIKKADDAKSVAEDSSIKALSKDEIIKVSDAIVKLVDAVEKKNDVVGKVKDSVEKFISAIDAADKKAGKGAGRRLLNRAAMKIAAPKTTAIFGQVGQFGFKVGRSALAAAEKSLAVHQGKGEAKAAE